MKQKSLLTKLVLLLVLLVGAGTAWAQSDYSSNYTGNVTLSTTDGTSASTCKVKISNTEYSGIKAGTSSNPGAVKITVPEGTKYLHLHLAGWKGESVTLSITPKGYSDDISLTTNSGISNNSPFTFSGDPSTSDYYKVITFTNALTANTDLTFKASSGKRFVVWGVTAEEEGSNPTCATPTFSPAEGKYTSAQNVTISTETSGATIYYTTDGSTPTTNSSVYSSPITVSENKTIKALAVKENYNNSAVATATYTIVNIEHAGTETDPYTVADARTAIDNSIGVTGVYVTGIVCEGGSSLSSGAMNYWISDDGTSTNKFEIYRGKSYDGDDFSSTNDVQVGDVVVVYGTITKYKTTYEFSSNSELVSLVRKSSITATPNPLAVPNYEEGTADPTYETLTVNGSNLTADITLSLGEASNFEMSADLENWSNTLTLTQTEGSVTNEEIAVRLKAGLAKGDYSGTLTLSTTGATDVTVSLSGSVTGTTYTISIDDDVTGGTIEADKASAAEGATVTLTAKPDDAYTFGSWTVYKDDMETVTVTNNQFTMPNCEVYVTATFTAKPTYKVTCAFNDAKGRLTATPEAAYEGQSVKLEYTTKDGYALSSIVITKTADGSATNIIPTASGNDYTFTMPGYAVTATATFVSNTFEGSFAKVTSTAALEDGGYYILYSTKAMNSTVTSGKMGATEVTVNANNIIENPDRAIVWKLVKNGDNWDLYSEKEGKYCYIEGTNTSAFKMAEAASYHYAVSVYDTGGFKFKTTHSSSRGINYGDNNFGSYADSNSPTVDLYKYTTLTERTITFDGNGGKTGENTTTYTQSVYDGVETNLNANEFSKDNHEFAGWATNSDGTGTQYADKAKVTVTGDDLTLYAQWNPLYTLTIDNSIEGGTVSITGNLTSAIEGKEITLSFSPTVGHAFDAWNVYKEGDATTTVTVTDNKFNMPAYNVVVSATFREATTYSLVTNANQIVSGKHYIIASGTDGSVKAMGEQKDNNRAAVDVTANDGVIPETTGVYEFVIFGPDANSRYAIYDATTPGYLYASSSSSNQLKTQATNNLNGMWTITINAENGIASIVANGSNNRNVMQYNGSNNNSLFACYEKASQSDVSLYVKDGEATPTETVHISDAKYATYCSENALDFEGTGVNAYIAKMEGSAVTFESVTKVPAYEGVLLKAEAAGDFTVNATSSKDNVTGNKLIGVTKQTKLTTDPNNGIFVLMNGDSGVGFYKTLGSEFTLGAHTAYLPALTTDGARTFIGLDNSVTGIENINVNVNENGNWYNLNGQRVETPKKGLYIVNGKKIMVK